MNSDTVATPPSVSWAQRSTQVFMTFNVECEKPEIKINSNSVYFKGICAPDLKLHEIEIPLFAEVDPERSRYINKGRLIELILIKAKPAEPFWPSLTSDKKKHHWLKVDFNRWQDENESGDEFNDLNDMFSNKMQMYGDGNEKDNSSSEDDEADVLDLE